MTFANRIAPNTVSRASKNGMEFITKQVEADAKFKKDVFIDFATLRMGDDIRLSTIDGSFQGYDLTEHAASQFCTRIDMPYRYFEKCKAEITKTQQGDMFESMGVFETAMDPAKLLSSNVNYWLEKANSKDLMFRLREQDNKKSIRGILTDRYTKFDNHEIIDVINDYLDKSNDDYEVQMWRPSDGDGFHLRLTFDAYTTTIGRTVDGEDDIHKIGIHVVNSEVGKSAVRIIPMVYRLVCKNGMMSWQQKGTIMSQRHAFIDFDTMHERVAVAIGESLKMGQHTVKILEKAKEMKVEKPYELIQKLADAKKYSKKFTEKIKEEYAKENDGSLFYLPQSVTRAAQTLSDDLRVEAEQHAVTLLSDVASLIAV